MIFYNLNTKGFTDEFEEGITFPSSDERVSFMWKRIPTGYTLGFKEDGFPVLNKVDLILPDGRPNVFSPDIELLPVDDDLELFPFYKEVDGEYVRDTDADISFLNSEIDIKVTEHIDFFISKVIDMYNKDNRVAFKDIYSFKNSMDLDAKVFPYVKFSKDIWEWSRLLWKDLRIWSKTLVVIPDDSEIRKAVKKVSTTNKELKDILKKLG